MNRSELITTRNVRPGDEAFILSTWLKGLLYSEDSFYSKIPKDIYFSNHHKVIERTLTHPATTVKIACLADDADVILAYAVYRQAGGVTVLDYVFVKKPWRGIGIMKSLVPADTTAVTNLTKAGESILKKYPRIHFNPYI